MSAINVNSGPAISPLPPADPRVPVRIGLAALIFGLGGFLIWAAWAPLDEGVPVPGVVAVETYRKTVQHLTGGIVQELLVKEGDLVRAGQPVLTLDMTLQRGQQQVIAQQLAGLQSQLQGLRSRLPQRERQLDSMNLQSRQLEPLVEEELYPRNRYAELQREQSRLRSEVITEKAALEQMLSQMAELREKHQLLQTEIDRAVIVAPVAGTVFGLAVHTLGGVIPPGGRILDLVPEGDTLIVNAQVPTHLIEQVRTGLPAQLRFIALNPRNTPVIEGRVMQVGADRVTDEQSRQSFYTARISVPTAELSDLGVGTVTPGMPVEVIVVTGERTFFNYLAKPLLDSFAGGLKER